MNESISRAAGAVHGQELDAAGMQRLIAEIGRPWRQRTTLYHDAEPASQRRAAQAVALAPIHNTPIAQRDRIRA